MIKISIRSGAALHREFCESHSSRAYAALRRAYPAEIASLLRRTCRGAARRVFALVLPACFFLAACSSESAVGRFFGALPPEAEPPPAEGRPYPNLATVPRPPKLTPRAEREAELADLQADRDAAAAADRQLRDAGTYPAPPPTVVEPAAPPLPAGSAPAPSAPVLTPAAPGLMATPVPPPMPAPAPVSPAAVAQAQPPAAAATTVQRVGAIAFARDGATLSEAGQRALNNAATSVRANNGRVRLTPAQVARQVPPADLAQARRDAIVQTLGRAGVPRERVHIDDGGGRRVDVYDVYVEY